MPTKNDIEQFLSRIHFLSSAQRDTVRRAAETLPAEGIVELMKILQRAQQQQAEAFARAAAEDPAFLQKLQSFVTGAGNAFRAGQGPSPHA